MSAYDKKSQKVVRAARLGVVNDMALDIGWLYGDHWHTVFTGNLQENFTTACSKYDLGLFFFLIYAPSLTPTYRIRVGQQCWISCRS